jgi:preprotein translocase subunit YajC
MDISLLLPIIVLLMFIPLFLSSRKQKRAQVAMQELQKSLEPGDVVSTTSGLRGTVVDASYEDTIDLEIADGVVTTWVRAAIRERITADEPAHDAEPPTVVDEPAAPAEPGPSLDKSPSLKKPALDEALEKDESTNGSPRS